MNNIFRLPDERLGADEQNYIRELQSYLRRIALENGELPELAIDGIYDPHTRDAVSLFQQLYGLPVTGVTDRATWDAVYSEFRRIAGDPRYQLAAGMINGFPLPNKILSLGDRGEEVAFLETMINNLAQSYLNLSPVSLNGVYDEQKAAAVSEIQRLSRLPINGMADRATWNALVREYNLMRSQEQRAYL